MGGADRRGPTPDHGGSPGRAVRRSRLDGVHGPRPPRRRDRPRWPSPSTTGNATAPSWTGSAGVAGHFRSEHLVVTLDTSAWGGSALTDPSIDVPAAGGGGRDPGRPTSRPATASSWPWPWASPRPGTSTPSGSGSTPSTTPATPTAAPSSSRRSGGWRPPARSGGSKADPIAIRTPLIECDQGGDRPHRLELDAPAQLTWSCYRGGDAPVRDLRRLRPAGPRGFAARRARRRPRTAVTATGPADRHPGHRGLLRHPGRGGAGRRAAGVRPAHRMQHPLRLLRPARGPRARPGPCRIERTPGRRDWQVVDSPLPIRLAGRGGRRPLGTSPTTRSA